MHGSTATAPTCTAGPANPRPLPSDAPSPIVSKKPATSASPPSLRRNISWTLLGNVVYAACQWGVLVVFARLGNVEMVGQFALAQAIATPVFMFASLNLRCVQVTDAADRYQPRDYVSLRVITTGIAFAVVLAIALSSYSETLGLVILAVAGVKATESFSDVIHGIQHKRECMRAICIARISRGVLSLISVIVLLSATASLTVAISGLAVVNALVLFLVDVPLALRTPGVVEGKPFALHCNLARLVPLAWLSLPVGLAMLVLSLNTNVPRYFIDYYLDRSALGYYAAAAYLLLATDLVMQSSRTTALPRLSRLFDEGRSKEFWKLTSRLMLLGLACTAPAFLAAWIAGGPILALIYGEEYRQAAQVFFWLMFANLIWQASVPPAVLLAMQRYWTDFGIRLVSLSMITVASWVLVPRFGLIGAAWAIVAGRVTHSLGTAATAMWLLRSRRLAKCHESIRLATSTTKLS